MSVVGTGARNVWPAWQARSACAIRLNAVTQKVRIPRPANSGLIFSTPDGRALDLNEAYPSARKLRWFRKAAREAGLSDEITIHDLRHFYASLLIHNGANVKLVQARLGHKSATETLDTYGHLWPDAGEQTRNILNEALTGLRKADSKLGVLDQT